MKTPGWLQPGIAGAAFGALALAIIGFTWGGWITGGSAKAMAVDQAQLEVVAALAPICVEQSKMDPGVVETLAEIKAASQYRRSQMIVDAGWATMPGAGEPRRGVAVACLKELSAQF